MEIKEYIASGILELYVAGVLSEQENREVFAMVQKHPEVAKEVAEIEAAILKLTEATAPVSTSTFQKIKNNLGLSNTNETKVIPLKQKSTNWLSYTGWAAAILLTGGLIWTMVQNNELNTQLKSAELEKQQLEDQIFKANSSLAETKKLNTILRDKDILAVPLGGQTVSPNSYAKVYWDKDDNQVYVDVQGLPTPPAGKVYQVWSLKLDPLTPTSIGILDQFNEDENKVFALGNNNDSEAFGITLEPEGGSETPTLEQLYTLGAVTTAAP
ncbi:anti-sigma factor [Aureibaculum sp. 2210JD6-5]|uniref:anti-sigma factor n=1 Tax=Aureibaculum sp. 2210JD6-5 TaxID=3103957 RepID=UPI002AADCC89|nr:anti-sigma factor [Aureibaculum sp. 2210JD6-5]MDY7395270.1 anti-sigma factor [Aureibaculum sp. 2210JD6-5]